MKHWQAVLLFVVGSFVGLLFADFDLRFHWQPLLVHRSLLTHGLLLPLLLFVTFRKHTDVGHRYFFLGLCIASAVHLCFDLFPRGWYLSALIHVPFYGWMGPVPSVTWLLASILVCLYLACRQVQSMGDLLLALIGTAACYGVAASREPSPSFWALATLIPAALGAFALSGRRVAGDDKSWHFR